MIGLQRQPYQQYREMQVLTSSPEKLTAMIYDVLLRSMERAQESIEAGEPKEAHRYLVKAQDCLQELQATLNYEEGGEMAQVLGAIYGFLEDWLVTANIRKDPGILPGIIPVARRIRDAWREMITGVQAVEVQ